MMAEQNERSESLEYESPKRIVKRRRPFSWRGAMVVFGIFLFAVFTWFLFSSARR
jgi:hypothetical protein